MMRFFVILLLFITFLSQANANSGQFEYHGYFRSGVGWSNDNDQVCFQNGAQKFRLGNECETYIDAQFSHLSEDQGVKFRNVLGLAMVMSGHQDWEGTDSNVQIDTFQGGDFEVSSSSDLTLALREVYSEVTNPFGSDVSFWAGKRYYQRRDVHMLDFFLLHNTGPGFGLTNLKLGSGLLSAAVFRNASEEFGVHTNLDLRYSGIDLWGSQLETVLIIGGASTKSIETDDISYEPMSGQQLALILTTGKNTLWFQYGRGLYGAWDGKAKLGDSFLGGAVARGDEDTKSIRNRSNSMRLLDHYIHHSQSGDWSLGLVGMYERLDFGGELVEGQERLDKERLVVGARPIMHLYKHFDLAFEIGHISIKNEYFENNEFSDSQLTKLTVAPTIVVGDQYWGRPNLRLFYTQAFWGSADEGKIGGSTYAAEKSGNSMGAQVEAWW